MSYREIRPQGLERLFLRRPAARYGSALLAVAAITLLATGVQTVVQQASIQVLYMLGIVLAAISGGLGPAILAALGSVSCLNFFFIEPRYTLLVGRPDDGLRLVEFVVLALLTGVLAAIARTYADQAQRRGQQSSLLYHLSQEIEAATSVSTRLEQFLRSVVEHVQVAFCQVDLTDPAFLVLSDSFGSREGPLQRLSLPLQLRGASVGQLQVGLTMQRSFLLSDEPYLLRLLGAQLVQSLERAQLAEVAAQAEALRESDRLKSALLSSISHDLRTPLTAVQAVVYELSATDVQWSPARRHAMLQTLIEQTERLGQMVSNLLDLTRIRSGAVRLNADWYAIDEVIYHTLGTLKPQLASHPVQVTLPAELPLLRLDFGLIEHVLANLLLNAAAYSPPDTPISISAQAEAHAVVVAVCDAGPGIALEERERLFEPFYRAPHTADRAHGSGMGLAIAQGFVAAHGGRIWITDPPQPPGTCVCFALPQGESHARTEDSGR